MTSDPPTETAPPASGNLPEPIVVRRGRFSPRQRQRFTRLIQYAVFVVIVGLVAVTADWNRLAESFFNTEVIGELFPEILRIALINTIVYTLLAFAFGLVVGLILALMRLSSIGPYRWFATAYIELFRGLPALLVLLAVAYGFPLAFPNLYIPGGGYGEIALGLGLTAAAYMAETIRAGIQAVPRGQMEAARTLGMSHTRAMISIILPQAFRVVIPPLTNEIILLTKDTSLVYILGLSLTERELTSFGRDAMTQYVSLTPLVMAGLLYLVITVPLSQLVRHLEVRTARKVGSVQH